MYEWGQFLVVLLYLLVAKSSVIYLMKCLSVIFWVLIVPIICIFKANFQVTILNNSNKILYDSAWFTIAKFLFVRADSNPFKFKFRSFQRNFHASNRCGTQIVKKLKSKSLISWWLSLNIGTSSHLWYGLRNR